MPTTSRMHSCISRTCPRGWRGNITTSQRDEDMRRRSRRGSSFGESWPSGNGTRAADLLFSTRYFCSFPSKLVDVVHPIGSSVRLIYLNGIYRRPRGPVIGVDMKKVWLT